MSKKESEYMEDVIKGADSVGCVAFSIMFVIALVAFAIMFLIDCTQ